MDSTPTDPESQLINALQRSIGNGEKLGLSGELCMLITKELGASIHQAQMLQTTLMQSYDHWFKAMSMGLAQTKPSPVSPVKEEQKEKPNIPKATNPTIRFRKKTGKKQAESMDKGNASKPPIIKILRRK